MSHLMTSMKPGADDIQIEPVGVGNVVEYFGRAGSMRQGRTSFPALVLKQHPDDGALDLLVFFEAEDILWEQRVLPWTEQRPDRCWAPVADRPINDDEDERLERLKKAIFGDFEEPGKSVMDYLNDFDERLIALEKAVSKAGKK